MAWSNCKQDIGVTVGYSEIYKTFLNSPNLQIEHVTSTPASLVVVIFSKHGIQNTCVHGNCLGSSK